MNATTRKSSDEFVPSSNPSTPHLDNMRRTDGDSGKCFRIITYRRIGAQQDNLHDFAQIQLWFQAFLYLNDTEVESVVPFRASGSN